MLGFSRSQMLDKVEQIHEFTGLREFAEMPLKYYSSGMYMRLAFAIATEVEPDILLIDESLGVGDAAFQDKAKARIRELARPDQGGGPGLARHGHRCASCARAGSGSSTAGSWPTARSTRSSTAISNPLRPRPRSA